jgi:hypothetical protein
VSYEPGPSLDQALIGLFVERDGMASAVTLADGRRLVVHNIAWGYDAGDSYAHVTTNVSPEVPSTSIDFFCTIDVVEVFDEYGAVIYP